MSFTYTDYHYHQFDRQFSLPLPMPSPTSCWYPQRQDGQFGYSYPDMRAVSTLETRLDNTDRFVEELRPPERPQPDPDPSYNQPHYSGAAMTATPHYPWTQPYEQSPPHRQPSPPYQPDSPTSPMDCYHQPSHTYDKQCWNQPLQPVQPQLATCWDPPWSSQTTSYQPEQQDRAWDYAYGPPSYQHAEPFWQQCNPCPGTPSWQADHTILEPSIPPPLPQLPLSWHPPSFQPLPTTLLTAAVAAPPHVDDSRQPSRLHVSSSMRKVESCLSGAILFGRFETEDLRRETDEKQCSGDERDWREQEGEMSNSSSSDAQIEFSCDNAMNFKCSYEHNIMTAERCDNPEIVLSMDTRLETEVDEALNHGVACSDAVGISNPSIALVCGNHGVEEDGGDAIPKGQRVPYFEEKYSPCSSEETNILSTTLLPAPLFLPVIEREFKVLLPGNAHEELDIYLESGDPFLQESIRRHLVYVVALMQLSVGVVFAPIGVIKMFKSSRAAKEVGYMSKRAGHVHRCGTLGAYLPKRITSDEVGVLVFDPGGFLNPVVASCPHLEDKVNFNRGGVDTGISSRISLISY